MALTSCTRFRNAVFTCNLISCGLTFTYFELAKFSTDNDLYAVHFVSVLQQLLIDPATAIFEVVLTILFYVLVMRSSFYRHFHPN